MRTVAPVPSKRNTMPTPDQPMRTAVGSVSSKRPTQWMPGSAGGPPLDSSAVPSGSVVVPSLLVGGGGVVVLVGGLVSGGGAVVPWVASSSVGPEEASVSAGDPGPE